MQLLVAITFQTANFSSVHSTLLGRPRPTVVLRYCVSLQS